MLTLPTIEEKKHNGLNVIGVSLQAHGLMGPDTVQYHVHTYTPPSLAFKDLTVLAVLDVHANRKEKEQKTAQAEKNGGKELGRPKSIQVIIHQLPDNGAGGAGCRCCMHENG